MSARTVQRTHTSGWQSSIAASAALTSSVSTDDPSLSLVTAPMPTLVIRFGGRAGAPFVLAQGAPPAQSAFDRAQRPVQTEPERKAPPVLDQPPEMAPPEPEEKPEAALDQPPETAPTEFEEKPEPSPDQLTEAAGPEPEEKLEALPDPPQEPAPEQKPAPNSNRIELIIDSLPNHPLSEPIPVTVDPLGDEMFTASMRDLDIAATGNSIGEALLFLKEQIDSTFDDLNRKLSYLTSEQKTTLQMLQTYIATPPARSKWF